MIGIKAISSYIPKKTIDNIKQGEFFGEPEDFIKNKIGALYLPRIDDNETTSDMACHAINNLLKNKNLDKKEVEAIILITQNGDGLGLPHTSAIIQSKLGLNTNVAAFDVSLGCSGYVYGLSILQGLMHQTNLNNGILITADPYSQIIDRNDRTTSLLFGDAATATWLSHDSKWKIGNPIFSTDGMGASHLMRDKTYLKMNGRQVFNFASKKVPQQIQECLSKNGLTEDQISLFCLHQGSKAILEAISKKFPVSKEKFISDIIETGNTVSSSIPLLLEKMLEDPELRHILVSGFGVGLSCASNIISQER